VLSSRAGLLALIVCFLPIGSGAASNLWSVMAGDWHASANTVALVNGGLGGLASAAGCLLGGWVCDRLERKTAYCLFGLLQVVLAVVMALAPRASQLHRAGSAYNVAVGMAYAGFSALVLEVIGRGAAATKYNIMASLSNVPIGYVTWIDGQAYERWGARDAECGSGHRGLGPAGLRAGAACRTLALPNPVMQSTAPDALRLTAPTGSAMPRPCLTRRALLRALPVVCLPAAALHAQELPLLQEDNPTARQLGYVADARARTGSASRSSRPARAAATARCTAARPRTPRAAASCSTAWR
jgi:MFS family permease